MDYHKTKGYEQFGAGAVPSHTSQSPVYVTQQGTALFHAIDMRQPQRQPIVLDRPHRLWTGILFAVWALGMMVIYLTRDMRWRAAYANDPPSS